MTSVDDLLGRVKPAEHTVRVSLDGAAAAEIDDLRRQVAAAKLRDSLDGGGLAAEAPQLERRLAELTAQLDAEAVEFRFRAIPGGELDEITAAHPPTEAQWERFREASKATPGLVSPPAFDAEAVAPILIARSVVAVDGEPVDWSDDEGRRLWETLPDGVRADLLEAAWQVNQRRSARPTSGTGTGTTPSSGPESTTPPPTASPTRSSAAGS